MQVREFRSCGSNAKWCKFVCGGSKYKAPNFLANVIVSTLSSFDCDGDFSSLLRVKSGID